MKAAIIGAGPAGLAAAELLSEAGVAVTVLDRMPSPARKLLMAGRGGLNITHTEPLDLFLSRYGAARARLEPAVRAFPPEALRAWCEELGQETFAGSSGRVFPRAMKAAPLLRAWLARLEARGVTLHTRHAWTGWDEDGALVFARPGEEALRLKPDTALLAMGGASWPRLGSDGGWAPILAERGVALAPFAPANMGLLIEWSDHLRDRFAGTPLKRIALSFGGRTVRGEAVVTARGLEGGAVYALSAAIRDAVVAQGEATVFLDLRPDMAEAEVARRVAAPRRGQSLSNHLRRQLALPPVSIALLREGAAPPEAAIKALPLRISGVAGLDRAISSAGGIRLEELDEDYGLRRVPGVFAAGEMLDWEAPTGGHLLTACFATGRAAARGMLRVMGR
ncbi:TIGR03862 family flavoprotein [Roseomonas sp. SSH11]|uniref:TIGR03862 family flavoprotein n=1 Tax=Pararoseomonas baculiformis TaxID=2820812 RepID=A0ABS4AJ31_9PROT|nr:TIGR03862 family flavoprotein [Pararoseomonas baculiformis]MBP0447045.1 TIGR03862 family flavoprotein [Pararoseomonas baculiformis]